MYFKTSFAVGNIYTREEVRNEFKNSIMSGLCKSNITNTLCIINKHTNSLYDDRWENDILHYTGMGQKGDQSISFMQNITLNESRSNGVQLHLFEMFKDTQYTYQGLVELADEPYQSMQQDSNNNLRKVWIFPLRVFKKNILTKKQLEEINDIKNKKAKKIKKLSDQQLQDCLEIHDTIASQRETISTNYFRDDKIAEYAKRRANGTCQLCKQDAPFCNKKGEPYLECHHIEWLANGGSDSPDNVVALCPSCHKKMHILNLPVDRLILADCASQKLVEDY